MKKIFIIVTATLFIYTSSCKKDFLNLYPTDQLSPSTFWKTGEDASAALTGCYSALWDVCEEVLPYLDVLTPNAYSEYPWEGWKNIALSGQSPTDLGGFGGIYKGAYGGISATNNFLANVDKAKMDEDEKNEMKGEVHFLRAYYYSLLVNYWGGVPLLTEETALSQKETQKSTREEVYRLIEKDLDEAANVLPLAAVQKGRVTKGAALALKTRVLLYQKKWTEASAEAKAVIDLKQYSLYADYRGLFLETNEDNSEVIFNVEFLAPRFATHWDTYLGIYVPSISSGWSSIEPTQNLVDEYEMQDGSNYVKNNPVADPKDSLNNRDPRLDQTVFRKGKLYNKQSYPVSVDGWPGVYTGYSFKKYTSYDNTTSTIIADGMSQLNGIIIRYADVLLMYAEAQNEAVGPDQSVYSAINQVRARPSVHMPAITEGLNQAQMRMRIRHERRVEFAAEGLYYSDIRRWGIAETALNQAVILNGAQKKGAKEQRVFKPERDYLMPFPQEDIDASGKKLVQNPHY